MTTSNRKYKKRRVGDIVNGAELVERVNGQRWKMRCKCGAVFVAQPSDSKGVCRACAYKKRQAELTVHGESPRPGQNGTRLYTIWSNMRARCNNPKNPAFKYYGGRGISVCAEWSDYNTFRDWALVNGYEEHLTIDRIDNDGNYCSENCRWATWKQQMNNQRKTEYKYGRDELGRFKKCPERIDENVRTK